MTEDPSTPSDGLAARAAAAALLEAALARRGGFDDGISLPALAALPARDRAFARTLALNTMRYLGPIDQVLEPRLTRAPPERVRSLLRLALAQALYLDLPAHAAVDTAVELAGASAATRPFKALVNAVLRGVLRGSVPSPTSQSLAPPWLFARWQAAYGRGEADQIAAIIAAEPLTDLSLRDPADAPRLAGLLDAEILPGGGLRTARRGDVTGWPEFEAGTWWVQDAAAALPARLLQVQAGEFVLDVCAAPGGKTLQLAAAGGLVTALDRSPARLERLTQNLARTGLVAETVVAEAISWPDARQFAAILLDAPCSATGTFRRHPDVLWASRPGDIATLAGVQARLLDAAAARLLSGGRLVYCVCSLEPEEGEGQVARLLDEHPELELMPLTADDVGLPLASRTPEGYLRCLPHHQPGGLDGFFAVRFCRRPVPSGPRR